MSPPKMKEKSGDSRDGGSGFAAGDLHLGGGENMMSELIENAITVRSWVNHGRQVITWGQRSKVGGPPTCQTKTEAQEWNQCQREKPIVKEGGRKKNERKS